MKPDGCAPESGGVPAGASITVDDGGIRLDPANFEWNLYAEGANVVI
jgi:hypothetical protein